MPLLDIINNVHAKLGRAIDYRLIPDNDESVLKNIRSGDIEKIFLFNGYIRVSPRSLSQRTLYL